MPFPRARNYASRVNPRKERLVPKLRYFFLLLAILSGAIHYAGKSVSRKQPKTSFSSEEELMAYEKSTGLRRRHKLIPSEKNDQYSFVAVPLCPDSELQALVRTLQARDASKQVCVVDHEELVLQELADKDRHYSSLLHELKSSGKPFPPGLVTALIKQHLNLVMNTRSGTFDTVFVLKNFPLTIDEAIKFENDVLDISQCILIKNNQLLDTERRVVENVGGYFDIVGKTITAGV